MSENKGLRYKIYKLVDYVNETGDGNLSFYFYNLFMLIVVIISLIPLAFKEETQLLHIIDIVTVSIFIIDFILRWITADYHFNKFSIKSFIIYPFSLLAIICLLSIIPSFFGIDSSFKLLRILRALRTLKVLRTTRTVRLVKAVNVIKYSKPINIIHKVLKDSKESLLAVCFLAIVYILISALLIFNVEPDSFNTFFDAVYWATLSLTSIGYGSIVPATIVGKIVAMFSSLFGIALIALSAGVITIEYMNETNKEKDNNDQ